MAAAPTTARAVDHFRKPRLVSFFCSSFAFRVDKSCHKCLERGRCVYVSPAICSQTHAKHEAERRRFSEGLKTSACTINGTSRAPPCRRTRIISGIGPIAWATSESSGTTEKISNPRSTTLVTRPSNKRDEWNPRRQEACNCMHPLKNTREPEFFLV